MNMKIRQLTHEEFEASTSLDEYAFQFTLPQEERVKAKERFRPEQVWGAFDDSGALLAHYTWLPFQVFLQGKAVPMGGIAGVATWPENRRQGLVAHLLKQALEGMRKEGQVLSFLHPFKVPFYRRFGWEVFCECKKYRIPAAQFPSWPAVSVKRGKAELKQLNTLYNRFASAYNGALIRNEEWWERTVLGHGNQCAVYYTDKGEAEGYLLYRIADRTLLIGEFVYSGEEARRGLWSFISNHDSMVTHAEMNRVPSDDYLPYLLDDPRISQEVHPYFMARIVDMEAFMAKYRFAPAAACSFHLSLTDQQAPWNQGLWKITVNEDGTPKTERIGDGQKRANVHTDIGTLTAVLLGYRTVEEMSACGKMSGNPEIRRFLGAAVPGAQTMLFDFF
ncbi:enhanced intracellular survival protein Eis [Paenibacillus spiritus]|nr:GNAT family N-acetyltransferase [Paenibacillus spiritus]